MFTIVRHNTVKFLERFGKLTKTLKPGLHFYVPFVSSVTKPVELRELYSDFDHRKVITMDNVEIDVDGIFFYKIVDPEKAFYSVEDFNKAIDDLSMSVSRSAIGKTRLDDMFQNRKELNASIREAMNKSTVSWGIECLNYEILKIELPKKIKDALRFVAEAERLRRRDVIISEAERTYQVAISEAQRTASVIVQEGKAEAVRIKAEELARGISEFSDQLKGGENANTLTQYLLAENYIKKYGSILKKSNVIVFPENADGKMDGGLISLAYMMKKFENNTKHYTQADNNSHIDSNVNDVSEPNVDFSSLTKNFRDTSSQIIENKPEVRQATAKPQEEKTTLDKDLNAFLNKLDAAK